MGQAHFGDVVPLRQPFTQVRSWAHHREHPREPGCRDLLHVGRAAGFRRRREEHAGLPQAGRELHRGVPPGGRGRVPPR